MNVNFTEQLIFIVESMYCQIKGNFEFEQFYSLCKKCIENNVELDDCKQAILRYRKRCDLIGLIIYIDNMVILQTKKTSDSFCQSLFFECKKIVESRSEPPKDIHYFLITTFGLQKLIDTHQMDYHKAKRYWEWCCRESMIKIKNKAYRGQAIFKPQIVVDNTFQQRKVDLSKEQLSKIKSMLKKNAAI